MSFGTGIMARSNVVRVAHHLPRDVAAERLDAALRRLLAENAKTIAAFHGEWDMYRLTARIRAMGQTVKSRIDVEPNEVVFDMKLPVMLRLAAANIENYLRRAAERALRS